MIPFFLGFAEPPSPASRCLQLGMCHALCTPMTAFMTMLSPSFWWPGVSFWITILRSALRPETHVPARHLNVAMAVVPGPSTLTVCPLKFLQMTASLVNMGNVAWTLSVPFLASGTTAVWVLEHPSTRFRPLLTPVLSTPIQPKHWSTFVLSKAAFLRYYYYYFICRNS